MQQADYSQSTSVVSDNCHSYRIMVIIPKIGVLWSAAGTIGSVKRKRRSFQVSGPFYLYMSPEASPVPQTDTLEKQTTQTQCNFKKKKINNLHLTSVKGNYDIMTETKGQRDEFVSVRSNG